MDTGTVKWFNDSKGIGFIAPDNGGEELFAHFSAIQMGGEKFLREGQKVKFDVMERPKGKQASNIQEAS
ncbi:'Cold-shock' DNA-binding domain protein [Collimonas arenae]|uniref:Cold shock-like protein CspA n=1 Tax=Collimonas arenae TaxID=279058 RepID=A0A127QKB8_9BURK|nr:cold-shock protein [Collimonas arenae]AMP10511.1 'Cold-shock' DNA-binding domain protein [Collimonas arenae]